VEKARVTAIYQRYEGGERYRRCWAPGNAGNAEIAAEFQRVLERTLRSAGVFPQGERHLLDVGCGTGPLLRFLLTLGASPGNLHGIDLIDEYVARARASLPHIDVRVADAVTLPFQSDTFDVVVMSTVLSSIIDSVRRVGVAQEALRVARPGGYIITYDLRVPNPTNRYVRRIDGRQIRALFPGCAVQTTPLTLLPPLARRLGRATSTLYPALSAVPVLRSHLFTVIRAPGGSSAT
jgi:SAM-dependent methyltransferase